MNIEKKHNELKEEIEKLKRTLETLTREKINKQAISERRQEEVINNSGNLDDAKTELYKQKKHKLSLIDNWSAILKAVCGITVFIVIYPIALSIILKLIEISASLIVTMTTICGFSALLVGAVALSFKMVNKKTKKKIDKIKDNEEYKQLEEKVKQQEERYEKSLELLETAREEYQDAKEECERQSKLLSEKELILSWFENTIINCEELRLEKDKTVEKPYKKIREIK